MQVACLQLASALYDPAANQAAAETAVVKAVRSGARFLVLPEFFSTNCSYDRRFAEHAEPLTGPTVEWMRETAGRYGVWLGGGIEGNTEPRSGKASSRSVSGFAGMPTPRSSSG